MTKKELLYKAYKDIKDATDALDMLWLETNDEQDFSELRVIEDALLDARYKAFSAYMKARKEETNND